MHGSAPSPPDPESERRGHEVTDVAIKPIMFFLIVLFVAGGVLQAVMSTIMNGVIVPESHVGVPLIKPEETRKEDQYTLDNQFRDSGNPLKSAEHLQRNTTQDMLDMYKEDDAALNGSGGVNNITKKVHIPIDRAMKIVIEKRKTLLKSREGASLSTLDPELPYPPLSLPYRSSN